MFFMVKDRHRFEGKLCLACLHTVARKLDKSCRTAAKIIPLSPGAKPWNPKVIPELFLKVLLYVAPYEVPTHGGMQNR